MMALNLTNKFGDIEMPTNELLSNIKITSTNKNDIAKIIEFISKSWGMSGNFEAFQQIVHANAELGKSVKAVDKRNGEMYGLLLLAHYPIQHGSPIIGEYSALANYLQQYTQINGHSFIIDERLRGKGIDKKMLGYCKDYIKTFDFVWCAVEKGLKSHNYWKKIGFDKVFSISDASFYVLPQNEHLKFDLKHYYCKKD